MSRPGHAVAAPRKTELRPARHVTSLEACVVVPQVGLQPGERRLRITPVDLRPAPGESPWPILREPGRQLGSFLQQGLADLPARAGPQGGVHQHELARSPRERPEADRRRGKRLGRASQHFHAALAVAPHRRAERRACQAKGPFERRGRRRAVTDQPEIAAEALAVVVRGQRVVRQQPGLRLELETRACFAAMAVRVSQPMRQHILPFEVVLAPRPQEPQVAGDVPGRTPDDRLLRREPHAREVLGEAIDEPRGAADVGMAIEKVPRIGPEDMRQRVVQRRLLELLVVQRGHAFQVNTEALHPLGAAGVEADGVDRHAARDRPQARQAGVVVQRQFRCRRLGLRLGGAGRQEVGPQQPVQLLQVVQQGRDILLAGVRVHDEMRALGAEPRRDLRLPAGHFDAVQVGRAGLLGASRAGREQDEGRGERDPERHGHDLALLGSGLAPRPRLRARTAPSGSSCVPGSSSSRPWRPASAGRCGGPSRCSGWSR